MKNIFTFLTLVFFLSFSSSIEAQCDEPSIVWEEDGMLINWIAKDNATSHILRYRIKGTFAWTIVEIENNSFYDISFLETCEIYQFRVRTVCEDDESGFTDIIESAVNCGTCYSEYCDYPILFDGISFINSFSIDDYTNESFIASGNGYEDYRGDLDIVLPPGAEVDIEIIMDPFGFFENHIYVYIDFNRDRIFTEDELVINDFIYTDSPYSKTITVPNDINFGISRVRAIITSSNSTYGPCNLDFNSFWGEVEEYCVILGEIPSACDVDFNLELEGVSSESASFSWEEIAVAQAYNYRFKKTSEDESEWNEHATIETFADLDDLDDCTEYEFEIRGVCPFDTSAYKNHITFLSYCPTDVEEVEIFNINSYPNPWTESLTISMESLSTKNVTISAISLNGTKYTLQENELISSGNNNIHIPNTSQLNAGVYIIEILDDSNQSYFFKAIKMN